MADYKEIKYEKQRGGVLITLNRPEALNAITRPMLKEFHHALDSAEADPEIRAVVITGAGRAFSSGFDQATTSGRRRDIEWPQGIQTGMSAADLMNYWSADDIKMLQLGSSPAMFASLEKGAVDGGAFTIPTFFLAEERGYRILADPVDMEIYYLQNSIDSTRSYIKRNRDQALRVIKALCEGMAYFRKNKKESMQIMQKKLRIQSAQERDVKYLELSYNLLVDKFYNQVPYATPKAVETTLEFIAGEEPKAKGADPKQFIDESLVREIEASGFIKQLYEKEYR